MKKLLKENNLNYPLEYYDLIINSYINGNTKQVIEQFNIMGLAYQSGFLRLAKKGGYEDRLPTIDTNRIIELLNR